MGDIRKRHILQIWIDVIFALFIREIRVRFNDKLGISWAIVEPMVFIGVLSLIRSLLSGKETYGIPTFIYITYGMLIILLFLKTFSAASTSLNKNKPLFSFRQVQPISATIASSFFELLIKVFVAFALYVFMAMWGLKSQFSDPLLILLVVAEVWILGLCLGLVFGILNMFIPEVKKIESFFTRPLFFISGVFFSLRDIPTQYWYLLDWNPVLHAIEIIRYASFNQYGVVGVSHNYLSFTMLCFVFMSLVVYQRLWKQAIS